MIEYGFAGGGLPGSSSGPVAEPAGWRDGRSASGCLDSFTRLHDASDAEIGEFAREWGVLGFCEHGLPGIHASCWPALYFPSPLDPSNMPILWLLGGERPWKESIEDWRGLARHLRAIREAAHATSLDEEPDFDDWLHLDWPFPSSPQTPIFGNPAPPLPAALRLFQNHLDRMGRTPPASPEGVSLAVNRLLRSRTSDRQFILRSPTIGCRLPSSTRRKRLLISYGRVRRYSLHLSRSWRAPW